MEIKSSPRLLRRTPPIVKATSPPNAGSRASFPYQDQPQAPLNPITRGIGAIVPPETRDKPGASTRPNLRTPQPLRPRRRGGRYNPSTTQASRAGLAIGDLPGIFALPGFKAATSQYPHRRVAELRRGGFHHPTQIHHPSRLRRPTQPFSVSSTPRQYPQRPNRQPAQRLTKPAKSSFTRFERPQSRELRAQPGLPFSLPSGVDQSRMALLAAMKGEHPGEPQRSVLPKA